MFFSVRMLPAACESEWRLAATEGGGIGCRWRILLGGSFCIEWEKRYERREKMGF